MAAMTFSDTHTRRKAFVERQRADENDPAKSTLNTLQPVPQWVRDAEAKGAYERELRRVPLDRTTLAEIREIIREEIRAAFGKGDEGRGMSPLDKATSAAQTLRQAATSRAQFLSAQHGNAQYRDMAADALADLAEAVVAFMDGRHSDQGS